MKRLHAIGLSGLFLGASLTGYHLYASEPATVEQRPSPQVAAAQNTEEKAEITVYKNPNCTCCEKWAEHLEDNGFEVTMKAVDNLQEIKNNYDVPRELMSCHTGVVDGAIVEGHVPARDIKAYLAQRKAGDATVGLAVPGMPHGAPGMETGRKDRFAVLPFTADGESRVVKTYDNY
jgi:hypothetical protein